MLCYWNDKTTKLEIFRMKTLPHKIEIDLELEVTILTFNIQFNVLNNSLLEGKISTSYISFAQ